MNPNIVFDNGIWEVRRVADGQLELFSGCRFNSDWGGTVRSMVAKLAHEGDADALWTVMMCTEDTLLQQYVCAYKSTWVQTLDKRTVLVYNGT